MLKRTYELDMVPGGIPLSIHLSQYDSDVTLVFQLYASQGILDIPSDGVTAQIRGTKLDGNGISAECSFEILDDVPTVTAHMTKQMTAIAGKNTFELVLTAVSGNTTYNLPSANFYLEIERAALDYDTLQSKSEIQEIEAILSNADGIIAALEVSRETQANMAALTTRAESAASSAESAASTASQARTDAVSAKDTAVNAVQGFNDTVNSATSSAVQSLQSEAQAQIANVQTAGNGIEEHAASVVASAKEAITSEKDTAVSAIGSEKESAVASVESAKTSAMQTIGNAATEIENI